MNLILDIFKGYEVEYNPRTKILEINKPISVAAFRDLRRLLKYTSVEIKDIRVYGSRIAKVRGVEWTKKNYQSITIWNVKFKT